MFVLKRVVPLVVCLFASSVGAATVDVSLNGDAARGALEFAPRGEEGPELQFSWLHHDDEGDVAGAGLHVVGFASSRIRVGIGGKVAYFDGELDDGVALGIGGQATFLWPSEERLSFTPYLYYAPDVLSFDGAEGYREVGLRVAYQVFEKASVYLGVRGIRADFDETASVDFDDGMHVGFRIRP